MDIICLRNISINTLHKGDDDDDDDDDDNTCNNNLLATELHMQSLTSVTADSLYSPSTNCVTGTDGRWRRTSLP